MTIYTNRELLRWAAEKPVHMLLYKGWRHALRRVRRNGYWQKLDAQLQKQIDRVPASLLRSTLLEAPQLVSPTSVKPSADWLTGHRGKEVERLIAEGNQCLELRWSLLSSELECRGFPVPWCSDWRMDHTWPRTYYAGLDYSALGKPTDVKYPWELSRFYFAATLGQVYALTGAEEYREHFFSLLRDWVVQNPVAWSINWCSPLEVALRGAHLATAFSFFSDMEDSDLRLLVHQLALHGAFLYRNVEYTDIRGNHFAGNLYGLLVLSCLLERVVPEAQHWRAYATRHVEREIMLQFCADGVNFEKSIHYHRFVLDLFLYCALLLERAGSPMSGAAQDRLLRALEFTAAYIRPDGTSPRVGDSDDGWVLRIHQSHPSDHRGTLAFGADLFRQPRICQVLDIFSLESLWLLGPDSSAMPSLGNTEIRPLSFRHGGFLFSKGNGCYLMFDVGDVGLHGRGGHGHHDALSFELSIDGVSIFVDPGMPTYTGDLQLRNRFRGTAAHNTAVVDGAEQASLWPERNWRLGNEARISEVEERRGPDEDLFAARHHGFERLQTPVRYHRQLSLNRSRREFCGQDKFGGEGSHKVQLFFHLAPGLGCRQVPGGLELSRNSICWLFTAEGGRVSVSQAEVSPSYGVRVPASVIEITVEGALPIRIAYKLKSLHKT
jgi:hypothetical protein